jgi:ubiquinone/menaquinone biosynthesis C-methylase UbiE
MRIDFYDKYASMEEKHWWFLWRLDMIERLIRSINLTPEAKILDIGCGTGGMLKQLENHGMAVGLDFAPKAIEHCRKRGAINIVRGATEHLPFSDDTFDVVSILDVIEHLDDDNGALVNAFRVTRPGGVVFITVPAFQFLWTEHDIVNQHRRRYTTKQLRSIIESAGFETVKLTYTNTTLFLPVLLFRLAKKMVRRSINKNAMDETDISEAPPVLNWLLLQILKVETQIFCKVNMPFGVSILAVVRKPIAH